MEKGRERKRRRRKVSGVFNRMELVPCVLSCDQISVALNLQTRVPNLPTLTPVELSNLLTRIRTLAETQKQVLVPIHQRN